MPLIALGFWHKSPEVNGSSLRTGQLKKSEVGRDYSEAGKCVNGIAAHPLTFLTILYL